MVDIGNSNKLSDNSVLGNNDSGLDQQMKRDKNLCPVSDSYYSKCPVMRRYYYLVEEFFASWSWSG